MGETRHNEARRIPVNVVKTGTTKRVLSAILWEKRGGRAGRRGRVNVVSSASMRRVLSATFGRIREIMRRKEPSILPKRLRINLNFSPFLLFQVCSSLPGLSLFLPKSGPSEVRTVLSVHKVDNRAESDGKGGLGLFYLGFECG